MAHYIVGNPKSGVEMGIYEAESSAAALDACAQDAGCRDYAHSCEITGNDDLVAVPTFTYTIKTDAEMAEVVAATADDAIRRHTADRGSCTTVREWLEDIESVGDGAWGWIESDAAPDGDRQGGSDEESLRDYLAALRRKDAASLMGRSRSPRKAETARENGRKGGAPRHSGPTAAAARDEARRLVDYLSDRQWDMDMVRASLPAGWTLAASVDESDLHPLTATTVAGVLRRYVTVA